MIRYLVQNLTWLQEQLGEDDDDYYLFDCPGNIHWAFQQFSVTETTVFLSPGQIELHTHNPVMRQLVDELQRWNFRLCGVFLLDSQFLIDASKYFSGVLVALSTMISLELPHINVLSKMDLLDKRSKKDIEKYEFL